MYLTMNQLKSTIDEELVISTSNNKNLLKKILSFDDAKIDLLEDWQVSSAKKLTHKNWAMNSFKVKSECAGYIC
jgi:hypothetical protein